MEERFLHALHDKKVSRKIHQVAKRDLEVQCQMIRSTVCLSADRALNDDS